MKFSSGLLFIASGTALYCVARNQWKLLRNILAMAVVAISLLLLLQAPLDFSLGLDHVSLSESYTEDRSDIASSSALSFICFGLSLLLLNSRSIWLRIIAQYLLHFITLIASLAVIGYLLSVPVFYSPYQLGAMALHTSLLFVLLSVSASMYNSDRGITGLLTGDGIGNIMARRLLPSLSLLVLLMGIAHIVLYRNGFISVEIGIALFCAIMLLVCLTLIYTTAAQLNKLNFKKSRAEEQLLDLNKNLEQRILERTSELKTSFEELEKSRMELWKSEALLKAVISNISSALFVKDIQGRYILCNAKFAQDLGLKETDILGKTAYDLFPEDKARLLLANEPEIITSRIYVTNEVDIDLKGVQKTMRTHKFPLLDEQGNVFAICGVSTDFTDEKRAQIEQEILSTQLQRKNQQLLNFAHITSHNLRSPVSNLNSLLWLYKESQTNEEKALLFEKFEIVIQNLSQTLNELVDALKIQEDTSKEREVLEFEDVFKKVKESMIGKILETEAVVSYNFVKAPTIEYPRLYLESILQNLLSNSLKYRSPLRTPVIHAETFLEGENIVLHFKDNGLGIDMGRHKDKLFGLNKTFHRHEEAKGVGLYITKTQVEAMGGSISALSEVNKGTTIIISFYKKSQ